MDQATYLIVGLIFFVGSFVQGFTGFGAALVAIFGLGFLMDMKQAVPVTVLACLGITLALSMALWRHMDRRKLAPLVIGSLPGVVLGALVLKQVPGDFLRAGLGVLLVGFALTGLLIRPLRRRLHVGWAYLAGFSGGLLGTSLSIIGPPSIVYASLTHWTKDQVRATLSGFFLAAACVTFGAHLVTGLITTQVVWLLVAALPGILAGTVAGHLVSKNTRERDYRKVLYGLLGLMGAALVLT